MPNFIIWKDRELKRLRDEMEKTFSLVCEGLNCPDMDTTVHPLKGVLHETSELILFEGVLSDYGPEDISVEISEHELIVSGCKREDQCDVNYSISGTFRSSYTLPGKVMPEQSEARFKDGHLLVKMPRRPAGFFKMRIQLD